MISCKCFFAETTEKNLGKVLRLKHGGGVGIEQVCWFTLESYKTAGVGSKL